MRFRKRVFSSMVGSSLDQKESELSSPYHSSERTPQRRIINLVYAKSGLWVNGVRKTFPDGGKGYMYQTKLNTALAWAFTIALESMFSPSVRKVVG